MAYIPGVTGAAFRTGLGRDVRLTREDQAKKARELKKYMSRRQTLGKWGGRLGSLAMKAALGATLGPAGLMIAQAAGAGMGSLLGGSTLLSGKGPKTQPGVGTGLLGSTYKQLGEAKGGIGEAMRGQALGAGASQIAAGLAGAAGQKLGEGLKSGYGKFLAGRTGQSGFEGTPVGNVLGMDTSGAAERFTPGMEKFAPSARAGMTGYSGFGMDMSGGVEGLASPVSESVSSAAGGAGSMAVPDLSHLTQNIPSDVGSLLGTGDMWNQDWGTEEDYLGITSQQGGYIPQYQIGGALGRSFGLSKPSLETGSRVSDDGKWISEYKPGQTKGWMSAVDELGTNKFMDLLSSGAEATTKVKAEDELARMKFLEAAQERASERVQEAEEDVLGGIRGAKDTSSAMQNYLEGQKFFRQQDPANIPYGEPMEPMMNPFTGEPLGDYDSLTSSPRVRGKLSLMEAGLGYKGSDEERMDESVTFPEGLYQDESEPESRSWIQRLLGRQMGGMMPGGVSNPLPYNLGGSVAQQPMAYQLGGLLKYRRSPFG